MLTRMGFSACTLTRNGRPLRHVALAALACLVTPLRLSTAQAPAVLSGRVVDHASAASVAGATVSLIGSTRSVTTDSAGRFRFDTFPIGSSRILVRSFPYRPFELPVAASSNELVRVTIELDSTDAKTAPRNLPAVTVNAEPQASNYRLADFNRRRITGRGQYLTADQIKQRGQEWAAQPSGFAKYRRG